MHIPKIIVFNSMYYNLKFVLELQDNLIIRVYQDSGFFSINKYKSFNNIYIKRDVNVSSISTIKKIGN